MDIDNNIKSLLDDSKYVPLIEAETYTRELILKHFNAKPFITNPNRVRLMHEVLPLLVVAEKLATKDLEIKFCSLNHEYDGEYKFSADSIIKIEVTRAIDGHNESLRNELAQARGTAPLFQKIEHSGTKNSRIFGPNEITTNIIDEPVLARLIASFEKKNLKSKYKGNWLIITSPLCKHEKFLHEICNKFWQSINRNCGVFTRIFIFDEDSWENFLLNRSVLIWDSQMAL